MSTDDTLIPEGAASERHEQAQSIVRALHGAGAEIESLLRQGRVLEEAVRIEQLRRRIASLE